MNTVSPDFIAALKDATIVAPELPQADAFETLELLEEYERLLLFGNYKAYPGITTTDYHEGSATTPDSVAMYGAADARILVSADHATSPYSKKLNAYRSADHGTGSLAMLLTARGDVQSIVPLGKQTYDVAASPDTHAIKRAVNRMLPGKDGFMSLHGMYSGKLTDISDKSEIQAIVGLGLHENEESRRAAEQIVERGKDIGLRVVIGNDVEYNIYDPETRGLKLEKDGSLKTGQLRAKNDNMTTNFAHRVMETTGVQIPSVQLELARLLVQVPSDIENSWHVDRKSRAMGVHLGYLLGQAATEVMRDMPSTMPEVIE